MNWADREYTIGRGIAAIRHKERTDLQPLVRAVIETGLPDLLVQATGSTFPNVSAQQLARIPWPILTETQETYIASVLGAIDDKIELHRRFNETLEEIARTIFKSWFVDFDPVRAKMEGRAPFGMDAETASAFPASLAPSDLGEIPEGWKAGQLDELVSISREGTNPYDAPDDLFDHYSIPAFDDGRRPVRQPGEEVRSTKFLLRQGCVLVSRLNPRIPRVWLPAPANDIHSVCSTEFAVTFPRPPFTTEFIYGLLSSSVFQDDLATLVTGTSGSHQRVKPVDLQRMAVPIPASAPVRIFTDSVSPMLRRIALNVAESTSLADLRDLLLPKFVSGELRIRDAEEMVEAAV
jgi:type I restriction enzyme S subunit